MTNEEAILHLILRREELKFSFGDIDKDIKVFNMAIEALKQTRWIPVSERLPEENEYIEDVCKYYLIQDEYGDMHVAHLSNIGWIPMDSLKTIGDEVIAWMPLPQPYKGE